ncbi:uncharacterized protein LOC119253243 isoform X2 [Talpa occidentalis]|uniref:uncharacterized protein LOC119253243 isoform X2 n=1 Tax=Talpa occidentalis TaxID=50954 RepID=UPI0023F8C554|nr:uncharacterized protein LOC119253243 isoform X2 [Talpa occidentalis]
MFQKPSPTHRPKMHRCSPLGPYPPPPRCHCSRSPAGRSSSSLHHLRVLLGAGTSATNVPEDYRFLLQDALIYNRSNHFIPPLEPVTRWYSAGWITPAYIVNTSNGSRAYPDLFHLLAATSPVRFRRPEHSVNASTVGTCVGPPYTLLVEGPRLLTITYHHHVFHVNCTDCILTNCITSVGSLSKATFVILHQPPYVMLPVSLQQPWYDNIGLYTLQLVDRDCVAPKGL